MGDIKIHAPVKLFTAISYSKEVAVSFLLEKLTERFGDIDSESRKFTVDDFTPYYKKEMGEQLIKFFVSFKKLITADELPAIKIFTNNLESKYKKDGNRKVNLDPGYLTQAKVVLATTKDYSHRLYMSNGIFADLHLSRRAKSFQAQPWTYPDYAQTLAIEYFNNLRDIYINDLALKVKDEKQ